MRPVSIAVETKMASIAIATTIMVAITEEETAIKIVMDAAMVIIEITTIQTIEEKGQVNIDQTTTEMLTMHIARNNKVTSM